MSKPRTLIPALSVCAALLLAAWSAGLPAPTSLAAQGRGAGNFISGEGLPNPAPNITKNWGELPAERGQTMGSMPCSLYMARVACTTGAFTEVWDH